MNSQYYFLGDPKHVLQGSLWSLWGHLTDILSRTGLGESLSSVLRLSNAARCCTSLPRRYRGQRLCHLEHRKLLGMTLKRHVLPGGDTRYVFLKTFLGYGYMHSWKVLHVVNVSLTSNFFFCGMRECLLIFRNMQSTSKVAWIRKLRQFGYDRRMVWPYS